MYSKYFDFNRFEKSIRKSLFEGIDLDDDNIEDARFEKSTDDNSELFRQEQFRMMLHCALQFSNKKYPRLTLIKSCFSTYIEDDQKHYTAAYKYEVFNESEFIYVFDYCFETKDLLIRRIENKSCNYIFEPYDIDIIANLSKYNINIYFCEFYYIGVYNSRYNEDYFRELCTTELNINKFAHTFTRGLLEFINPNYIDIEIPHIFVKNFKGFTFKRPSTQYEGFNVMMHGNQFESESDSTEIIKLLLNNYFKVNYNGKDIS